MRGAHHGVQLLGDRPGIIPAYAGSTVRVAGAAQAGQDHPRVCGEHSYPNSMTRTFGGSSPRMRGAQA